MPFTHRKDGIWFVCAICKKKYKIGPVAQDLRIYECPDPACHSLELYNPLGSVADNSGPDSPLLSGAILREPIDDSSANVFQMQRIVASVGALKESLLSQSRSTSVALMIALVGVLIAIIIAVVPSSVRKVLEDELSIALRDGVQPELRAIKESQQNIESSVQAVSSSLENDFKQTFDNLQNSQNQNSHYIGEIIFNLEQNSMRLQRIEDRITQSD